MEEYNKKGFEILHNIFDPTQLKQEAQNLKTLNNEQVIYETNGAVRSVFAPHWASDVVRDFVYINPIIPNVKEILGNNLYLHQVHFNYKTANTGGEYAWHSDYTFWKAHDGMQSMDAISVLFLLDDMTIENGPLEIVEGSHNIPVHKKNKNQWTIAHDSSETDGIITDEMVSKTQFKRHTAVGKAGDVILMHANCWHKSAKNTSNFDRNILFVCYNRLDNAITSNIRPNHIVLTDFSLIP